MAHILLAKNEEHVGDFLCASLRKAGHSVEVIHNGFEALSHLQDDEKTYDLLLTDIVMDGIDGVELVRRAGDMRPDMRAMFIKGFAAVGIGKTTPDAVHASSLKTRLSKPMHLRDLPNNVDQFLAA